MSGTLQGGKKAARTTKLFHGKDFYARIGKLGGSVKGVKKGFALIPKEKRQALSAKGLRKRRGQA